MVDIAIQILIGGQDYTKYVNLKSVKVNSNIAVSSDTANLDVLISDQVVPRPKGAQEIKIMNGSVVEFGGVILAPKEVPLATDQMEYQTQCQDYTFYLDKRVVTNTYAGYTAGNIVKDVVAKFTEGFTSNHVQGTDSSFTFPQIKFDHQPPSAVIGKLAKDVAFQWRVDYHKDVHFGEITTFPSPLPSNLLDVDNDTTNYSDLDLNEDVSQVRNQIYLYGYKIPADYQITESFVADGQTKTFYSTYEPKHSLSGILVKVGGTLQKNKLDIAGGLPNSQLSDGTCYIYYKNNSYRFNDAPASGTVVSITYFPMFEQVNLYNDPNSMAEMKKRDLQDGVYEYAIRDRQLTSIDISLANTRGQLELDEYAYPHYSGQFKSFLQGWQPGQYFNLTSNRRMDGEFQNKTFYVTKVQKEIVSHPANGEPTFKYTISFSDSPYVF